MIIAIVKASIAEGKHAQLREVANILQNEYIPHEFDCEQYEFLSTMTLSSRLSAGALKKHLMRT